MTHFELNVAQLQLQRNESIGENNNVSQPAGRYSFGESSGGAVALGALSWAHATLAHKNSASSAMVICLSIIGVVG